MTNQELKHELKLMKIKKMLGRKIKKNTKYNVDILPVLKYEDFYCG